jgi:hypothetical protein
MLLGVGLLLSVLGMLAGMLVMRANYKHFRDHEAELKAMILDASTSAEQIVMRMRNKINI